MGDKIEIETVELTDSSSNYIEVKAENFSNVSLNDRLARCKSDSFYPSVPVPEIICDSPLCNAPMSNAQPVLQSRPFDNMNKSFRKILENDNSVSSSVRKDLEAAITGTYTERRILQVLTRAQKTGKKKKRVAWCYKLLNHLFMFTLIGLTLIMTIVTAILGNVYIAILSGIITAMQVLYHGLKLGNLGPNYMKVAIEFLRIKREVMLKIPHFDNDQDVDIYLCDVNQKMDEMDMTTYAASYGPSSLKVSGGDGVSMQVQNNNYARSIGMMQMNEMEGSKKDEDEEDA